MQSKFWTYACVATIIAGSLGISVALASDAMPVAQQNSLVQKYCAGCHNDAHLTGGLSLEHFDAVDSDPSLAAMLLSKLTNGLSLSKVKAANADQAAAAAIDLEMKSSAIHAAGLPAPDSETARALVMALSAEAARATEWTVNPAEGGSQARLTASVLREVPTANSSAKADVYRLVITCEGETHVGRMLLAWAPGGPKGGTIISVVADGQAWRTYQVVPTEKAFKGSLGSDKAGPGAAILHPTAESDGVSKLPSLPEQTLAVSNLLPDGPLVFSFGDLPRSTRQALSRCFTTQQ